jgi:uncharacterized protein YkwD
MTAKIKTRSYKSGRRSAHKPKGVSVKAFKKVYWPYIPVLLIISVLLSLTLQSGAISVAIAKRGGQTLAYATSMSSGGLLSSTNTARAQSGVASLKLNSKLIAAAQAKAEDMAARNYWSHNTPEGNPPWIFVTNQGYSYQKLGENLATGFSSEQATVDGWMGSAPHRANMLDSAFNEVGFGWANNANYTSAGGGPMTIVVAFYGKPQVLSNQSAPTASPPPPVAVKKTTPAPASPPPAAPPPAAPEPAPPENQASQQPPNSESISNSSELADKSSRAQLVLANFPIARFATTFALLGAAAAIAVWLSRHVLALRKALLRSERFAIRHPLLDIGLLIIATLFYLLTQTAGFIQ